jgi:hypothetical protein
MKKSAPKARASNWRVGTVIGGVAALGLAFFGTVAGFGREFGYVSAGIGAVLIAVAVIGRKPF